MASALPIVALVGEPNVGKSTFLNKISGNRAAVTSAVPGTTRDRQYVDTEWNGVPFTMVDTAGISFGVKGELELALNDQLEHAIDQADMLVFLVDGKQPVHAVERKALLKFRRLKKPVVLVVNKVDSARIAEQRLGEFQSLGVKPAFTVSSLTGRGTGDLLDYLAGELVKLGLQKVAAEPTPGIAVSIVGKPNVGKSSLFNKIIQDDRVVVSSIPGTTRTAIDTTIKYHGDTYTFIDTAGLKKKAYRQEQPDVFGGFQTFKAMRRSDVCLLVIEATSEITKQDQHIAQEIFELNKGIIIVVNKMDLYDGTEDKLRDYISDFFPFLWMSPLFFVSSVTGAGIDDMLKAIKPIFDHRHRTVPQEALDMLLAKKMKENPPKLLRDQRNPKVLGLTQVDTNPPTFELYVNYPAAISSQFRKYLEKGIIKDLGFWGTTIKLRLRGKDKS
jgi:GTP-binding protein